jgi:hypothetical protein
MVRRVLLALTFVAALGVGSVGLSNTADAHGGCYRGGYGGGYGRSYYGAYYAPAPYYGPRVRSAYYGPAYYGPGPGYISYGRYGRHSGFSISLGF